MASISIARRYGARSFGNGKNIARGYRLDSQSIFSQLSQPLFTAPADVDRRQECGVARMSPFLMDANVVIGIQEAA
jgi:hypothetical protein